MAGLPTVFPDGTPLDKKAHPWPLIGLVHAHVHLLRQDEQPYLIDLQLLMILILAWWLVPVTLLLFWLFVFWAPNEMGSVQLACVSGFSFLLAARFLGVAGRTLRLEESKTIGEYLRSHKAPLTRAHKIIHLVGEFPGQVNIIAWVIAFFTFMYLYGR